jgi:hypothetical protein
MFYGPCNGLVSASKAGLAPTMQAVIGADAHKKLGSVIDPGGERLNAGNFHSSRFL